ncbi:MAG: sensor histidine kinase [Cyanobacteria bacterium]|nr:sensor histidine kinase [Cyanobacteriota bacterium]
MLRNPLSIRRRIVFFLLGPFILLCLIQAFVLYCISLTIATDAFDEGLKDTARVIQARIKYVNRKLDLDLHQDAQEVLRGQVGQRQEYSVWTQGGQFLLGNPHLKPPSSSKHVEEDDDDASLFFNDTLPQPDLQHPDQNKQERVRVVMLPTSIQSNPSVPQLNVLVSEDIQQREDAYQSIVWAIVIPELVMLFLGILLIWVAVRFGLQPLEILQALVVEKHPGDLEEISLTSVPKEVFSFTLAINGLLGRLREAYSSQIRFLSNAAHQLKTPIAGLQTYLDILSQDKGLVAEQQALLSQMQISLKRTNRLVNQLLSLARYEPSSPALILLKEPLDLSALVQTVAIELLSQSEEAKKRDIQFEGLEESHWIDGNQASLQELLINLIDNAIRYSPEDGSILVSILNTDNTVVLRVDDSGEGIPLVEQSQIWERFYRGAHAEQLIGSGLGLSIVKEIAEFHQAQVAIQPSVFHPENDAAFEITFLKATI